MRRYSVSVEPAAGDHEFSASNAQELAYALPELLGTALRARIYDRRGKIGPAKKRRDRVASSLIADLTSVHAVTALKRALRLRTGTEIMDWMQAPDFGIEFADAQGMPLVTLGLLWPDWLRWGPFGDLQLAEPCWSRCCSDRWA
jgi:hypothetical protein